MPRTAITNPTRKTVENLVVNGDFEYAPSFTAATTANLVWIDGTAAGSGTNRQYGWSTNRSGTIEAYFDSSVRYTGSNSLKLSTKATASYVEARSVLSSTTARQREFATPVLPSTSYTISGWMKTNVVSGDSEGASFGFYVTDGTGAVIDYVSIPTTQIKTTTDWTYYSRTFTTRSTAAGAIMVCRIYGHTGTATLIMDAWFDDFKVTKTTPQTRSVPAQSRRKAVAGNIVYNGDFEVLPSTNTAITSGGDKFLDGTASGSTTDNTYGWYIYNYVGTRSAIFDTVTKYAGNGSLKLTTNAGSIGVSLHAFVTNDASWSRNNLPCEPNTNYYISVWVKTNVISGSATTGAAVSIAERDKTNASVAGGRTVVTGIVTTTDWTQYTATLTTSATTRFLQPQFTLVGNNGAATLNAEAWFDNLSIVQTCPRKDIDNLLFNGNFEYVPPFTAATSTVSRWIDGTSGGSSKDDSPYRWFILSSSANTFSAQFDTSVYHSGAASLKLSTTDATGISNSSMGSNANRQTIERTTVPALPNTTYTLTGWIKTNNAASNAAYFDIIEYNNTATNQATNSTSKLSGTNDWTQLTKTFTTSSNTRYLLVICRNNVAGNVSDAWFDDITLAKN